MMLPDTPVPAIVVTMLFRTRRIRLESARKSAPQLSKARPLTNPTRDESTGPSDHPFEPVPAAALMTPVVMFTIRTIKSSAIKTFRAESRASAYGLEMFAKIAASPLPRFAFKGAFAPHVPANTLTVSLLVSYRRTTWAPCSAM